MRWRSEVILAVSLLSALVRPAELLAQAQVPADCACLLRPDKPHGPGHPDPGTPGVPEIPGNPDGPGIPDSTSGDHSKRTWVYLGAAGVALLAGLPLGGSSVQGLPFAPVGGPPGSGDREVAELPQTPGTAAETPTVSRGEIAPVIPSQAPGAAAGDAPAVPEASPLAMIGLVPPKTATHLPLLAALGLLLVGGGALLARRTTRERRRRRRFVAI
jgi:LPXTG-motif cell wall-anchored protein